MLNRYTIQYSRCQKFAPGLLHIAALVVIWLTDVPLLLRWGLSVVIFISLVAHVRLTAKISRSSICYEILLEKNNVTFIRGDMAVWHGTVLPQTVVMPYFILLCVKPLQSSRTFRLLICADALPEHEFRQLRTQLRFSQ